MTEGGERLSLSNAVKAIGNGVTYDMLIGACQRSEVRFVRESTRMFILAEDIPFLREWFLERARLKDKEATIGKYDKDSRRAIRELAQQRIRESDNARGQEDAQELPGRIDGPGAAEQSAKGGSQC